MKSIQRHVGLNLPQAPSGRLRVRPSMLVLARVVVLDGGRGASSAGVKGRSSRGPSVLGRRGRRRELPTVGGPEEGVSLQAQLAVDEEGEGFPGVAATTQEQTHQEEDVQ